jgi:hypothetical protein
MKRLFLFLIVNFFVTSCSEEKVYTPIQMFQMAYDFDSTIEEVRINDPIKSIKCTQYPKGCIKGSPKRFKIRLVTMIVVQFLNEGQACRAAVKLNQYYTRNWLFDDVKGEPVLESFVKKVYDAKNPQSADECP